MSVTFDAACTSVASDTGNSGSFSNANLTIGASATILIAILSFWGSTTPGSPTGVTWNGVGMTQLGSQGGSNSNIAIYAYGLVVPATGNHTCAATYTAGSGTTQNYLDCFSFNGSATGSLSVAGTISGFTGDNSTPSTANYPSGGISLTTLNNGDMAVGACATHGGTTYSTAVASGSTLINTIGTGGGQSTEYNPVTGSPTHIQFNSGASGGDGCALGFVITQPVLLGARLLMMREAFLGWRRSRTRRLLKPAWVM